MSAPVLAAMSGGVDSSVAAALLLDEGIPLEGAYMKNWINEDNLLGDCPWQQDIQDASSVAGHLGLPFRIVNLMDEYRTRIVDYLLREYQQGLTPNPDVMCNREIKFGVFLQYALDNGFSEVATGHYARIRNNPDGTRDILEGRDPNKDQSYFLALMQQHQIARARFPIGEMEKPDVREYAHKKGLTTAAKKDSQGICFIGQIKMSDFLKAYVPPKPGLIVNPEGETLGEHEGLHLFTYGQRKGIRVASPRTGIAYVVIDKRPDTNELVIDFEDGQTPGLFATRATLRNLSYTNLTTPSQPSQQCDLLARPRYRAAAVPVRFEPDESGKGATITFLEPQRALAPGQVCALYDGEVLLGGGIFNQIFASS